MQPVVGPGDHLGIEKLGGGMTILKQQWKKNLGFGKAGKKVEEVYLEAKKAAKWAVYNAKRTTEKKGIWKHVKMGGQELFLKSILGGDSLYDSKLPIQLGCMGCCKPPGRVQMHNPGWIQWKSAGNHNILSVFKTS